MANCKEFMDLLPKEKIDMIGKIVHAVQSDSETFHAWQRWLKKQRKKDYLKG